VICNVEEVNVALNFQGFIINIVCLVPTNVEG